MRILRYLNITSLEPFFFKLFEYDRSLRFSIISTYVFICTCVSFAIHLASDRFINYTRQVHTTFRRGLCDCMRTAYWPTRLSFPATRIPECRFTCERFSVRDSPWKRLFLWIKKIIKFKTLVHSRSHAQTSTGTR